MSKLYFRYGTMNSVKTTTLAQVAYNYWELDKRAIIVKPSIDTKAGRKIQSRIGLERDVDILLTPSDNFLEAVEKFVEAERVDCVLVDEAQFLTPEQVNDAFRVAVTLDIPVIAYGLRTDFQTRTFPGAARLLAIAHSLEEMKSICRCKKKAIFNGRKVDGVFTAGGEQVAIDGEGVRYESLCGACFFRNVGELPDMSEVI